MSSLAVQKPHSPNFILLRGLTGSAIFEDQRPRCALVCVTVVTLLTRECDAVLMCIKRLSMQTVCI